MMSVTNKSFLRCTLVLNVVMMNVVALVYLNPTHFVGRLENIRLGWKGLPGTNTPAYFASLSMAEKKFCCFTQVVDVTTGVIVK
jgi:hypothetical protein